MVTLDEMKNYLRVDEDEDDVLIQGLLTSSERLCMDIAREDDYEKFWSLENAGVAVMFTTAYLYEHREEADHHDLTMTLRSLLFGAREGGF
ncbi:MAG: head-tail connector protein [Anaerovoracaceae bacterium]